MADYGHDNLKLAQANFRSVGSLVQRANVILTLKTCKVDADLHSGGVISTGGSCSINYILTCLNSPFVIVNGCAAVELVTKLADLALDGYPTPIGQNVNAACGQISDLIPRRGIAGSEQVLFPIGRVACALVELVEGLVSEDCLISIPHRSLVQLKCVSLCIFGSIEECYEINIEVVTLCAGIGEEVKTQIVDVAVGNGSNAGQINDSKIPSAILVPTYHGVIAATAGIRTGADKNLTLKRGIGAVGDCQVLRLRACSVQELEVGVAAGRGQTNVAVHQLCCGSVTGLSLVCQARCINDPGRISGINLGRRRRFNGIGVSTGFGVSGTGLSISCFGRLRGCRRLSGLGFTGLGRRSLGGGFLGAFHGGIGGVIGLLRILTCHKHQHQRHQDSCKD